MNNIIDTRNSRPTLVLSGVGMKEGGILSVLRHVIDSAERTLGSEWRIIALVHKNELISTSRVELIEFPQIKASWFRRLHFEWIESSRLAKKLGATVWFSLHDITSLVDVERQYVYCHSPSCFTRPSLRAAYFDWIFVVHSLMYGWIYRLNIHRNHHVFVQQAWIREIFLKKFGAKRVIVSRPSSNVVEQSSDKLSVSSERKKSPLRRWIFPTFPRHFKNIEIIGEALKLLADRGKSRVEVNITIDGTECRYARWLYKNYYGVPGMNFIGRLSSDALQRAYKKSDGLLFPSKLETWGLPITESQHHGLALLVADCQYAHETVGKYDGVCFFDPNKPQELAKILLDLSLGNTECLKSSNYITPPDLPTVNGWDELIRVITHT